MQAQPARHPIQSPVRKVTTICLADMDDLAAVDAVYGAVFAAPPPARSAMQVVALPDDARVTIDLVAVLADQQARRDDQQ